MTYNPEDKILIISICSFNKNKGSTETIDFKNSILNDLTSDISKKLFSARNEVLENLWKGNFDTQGQNVSKHIDNKELMKGYEFGGNETIGSYLPALARYNGRFYDALGKEGKIKIINSKHHFLIISGLYGIVRPMEPIQLYSVPIEKDSLIQKIWKKNHVLTEILIEYAIKNKIKRVFDFSAQKEYRELIDWERLANLGIDVFHCFSIEASDANALKIFGIFIKDYILEKTEKELLEIQPDTIIKDILFRTVPKTFNGYPQVKAVTYEADELIIYDWKWLVNYDKKFFRDFDNLGGVEEKTKVLNDIMEIRELPNKQIKDIQKPYSENLKGKWRRRSLNFLRIVYSFNTESRMITIHELVHK